MKLHPAEVAAEITHFPFFKGFDESVILQIGTMMEVKTAEAGDCILVEGQKNKSLFFLRQGDVDLFLKGKKIASMTRSGDVFGEMSVITDKAVSSTITANTKSEYFELNTDHFGHVHPNEKAHFEVMLYKIFCNVLVEKINSTNSLIST